MRTPPAVTIPPAADVVAVPRRTCVATVAVFLALLAIPGLFQLTRGTRPVDAARWRLWLAGEATVADGLRRVEADVDARFLLAAPLRIWLADAAPAVGRATASADTTRGVDGWIFVTGDAHETRAAGLMNPRLATPTRARAALADLAGQLRARGVHLLVVPVPAKASICPDRLDAAYDVARGPDLNVDHAAWFAALRADGVDALDLTDAFWQSRADVATPTFVATDSHWTYAGVERAAAAIAARLAPHTATLPRATGLSQRRVTRARPTDLVALASPQLDQAARDAPITETRAYLVDAAGRTVRSDDAGAPVLVLGDSYAALFTDLGSGLPQALSAATGVGVRSAAVVGGSPWSMREMLGQPGALRHVRVVVLAFAIRQVIAGDWRPMPVAPSPAP